jgi:hypothetical protein
VLEEDPRHLPVGLAAEPLVEAEARGVPQLVELGVPPVVQRSAWSEQPPHHPVRIPQGRRRIEPDEPLEGLLASPSGADRVLDDLDDGVEPDVLPHGGRRLGDRPIVGRVAGGNLDVDGLVAIGGLLDELACFGRIVAERRQGGIVVVVAQGDRSVGHARAASPELPGDRLSVQTQRQSPA